MALFGRRRQPTFDDSLPDAAWLAAGQSRFERGKGDHFGSPETMRAGAAASVRSGDLAAGLYFYVKAIDIAQTWSFMRAGERGVELDAALFDEYATLVETVRRLRPSIDLGEGWQSGNEANAVALMVSVMHHRASDGPGPAPHLEQYAQRVVDATSTRA